MVYDCRTVDGDKSGVSVITFFVLFLLFFVNEGVVLTVQ